MGSIYQWIYDYLGSILKELEDQKLDHLRLEIGNWVCVFVKKHDRRINKPRKKNTSSKKTSD